MVKNSVAILSRKKLAGWMETGWVGDGWMDGWVDGWESGFKDCLQQSKIIKNLSQDLNCLAASTLYQIVVVQLPG